MRTLITVTIAALGLAAALALGEGCDKEPTRLDQMLEASTGPAAPIPVPDASTTAPSPAAEGGTAGAQDAGTSGWDGSMPPRPIPKPSMTVGSGMPAEVQMKTIAYMSAMSQPRFDDAPADPDYAASLVAQLKPVLQSFDKGSPEEKLRLERVESIASGRRIDLLMAEGCNAELPRAATQRIATSFVTLLAHGVLVVRCNDSRVQCLQSTRDPSDVLCTTAPRHR
jgi:hypothetical protein